MKYIKSPFILIGLSEFFAKAISWLSLAIIPFFAKPEVYGEIVLYYSIILFFIPLYLFGQDRLILKNQPDTEVKNSLYFSSLILLITIVFLYYSDFIFVGVASFFLALNKILLTYLRANNNFGNYSFNRVLYSILRLILVVFVVIYFYSLTNYLLAEMLAALIMSLGLFYIVFKNKEKNYINLYVRFKHGLPLMLHGVSLFGVALIDRFFLEFYTNFSIVGNYSFIYIFASGLVFLYSIVTILKEKEIYKSENDIVLVSRSKRSLILMVLIGVFGSIGSILLYVLINTFNLVNGYDYLIWELFVLIVAHLFLPFYLISNFIIIQKNRSNLLLICSVFSLLINVLLNYFLIPKFGLQGAVWATFIANLILAIISSGIVFNLLKDSRRF